MLLDTVDEVSRGEPQGESLMKSQGESRMKSQQESLKGSLYKNLVTCSMMPICR